MMNGLSRWLLAQRSSPRLAFLLQIGCRALTSLCSLLWIPLLLGAMGKSLNGLFLNFQSITSLGGLGDLGMGGLVNIQTSRMLGQGKEQELKKFLSAARTFFGIMALLASSVFLIISPWLLRWQKFEMVPHVGPLPGLYVLGALAVGLVTLNSYTANLNYGCANLVWPVVPMFIILQLEFLGHWLLARTGAPLWLQYLPYQAGATLIFLLGWLWIRLSHPSLGTILPLTMDWKSFTVLAGKSLWVYLYSMTGFIYTAVGALLITSGFGPAMLPAYRYNNRLCELAFFVVNSACVASLPKITQWLASPEIPTRERALREAERLNRFQTLMGCSAALLYLAVNDWFIHVWLGKSLQSPLSWQAAFALTLAVQSGGQVGLELSIRCSDSGIRVGGIAIAVTTLCNIGLAVVATRLESIFGIALATLVCYSALLMGLGWYTCRQMKMSWWRLSVRNWLLALLTVGLGVVVRVCLPDDAVLGMGIMVGYGLLAFLFLAYVLRIRASDLRDELSILRSMFARG